MSIKVCKNEVILVKVTIVDRVNTLKILLSDEGTEKEIPSILQQQRAVKKTVEDFNDEEELDDTEVTIEEIKLRGWNTLGSEVEIISSHAPNQRPLVNINIFISKPQEHNL